MYIKFCIFLARIYTEIKYLIFVYNNSHNNNIISTPAAKAVFVGGRGFEGSTPPPSEIV